VRDPRFRNGGNLHSDQKIEVLYKSVMWGMLFAALLYAAVNGVEFRGCTLTELALADHCGSQSEISDTTYPLIYGRPGH